MDWNAAIREAGEHHRQEVKEGLGVTIGEKEGKETVGNGEEIGLVPAKASGMREDAAV